MPTSPMGKMVMYLEIHIRYYCWLGVKKSNSSSNVPTWLPLWELTYTVASIENKR